MATNAELEPWVRKAQSGDLDAYRHLWEETYPTLHRLAGHLCRDSGDADDLVQRTFIQCWKALPTLKEPGAFIGWLRRILVNRFRDTWRARKPNDRLEDMDGFEPCDDEPLVSEAMAIDQRHEAVRRAVASLPEHQREVMALYYLEEMDVLEVASTLSLPKGTVLSRLSRGRDGLRQLLSPLALEVL